MVRSGGLEPATVVIGNVLENMVQIEALKTYHSPAQKGTQERTISKYGKSIPLLLFGSYIYYINRTTLKTHCKMTV